MKLAQINGGVFGSTGTIMFSIAEKAKEAGMQTLCISPVTSTNRKKEPSHPYWKLGSYHSRRLDVLLARLTGLEGCFAWFTTARMLRKLKRFSPDILHFHNLHGSYINLSMLFSYIKKSGIRVIWTLHDCWAFTGHCPHFTMSKCDKWKTGCNDCPRYREYPQSLVDNSKHMYRLKKKWFTGVENLTIVTPSQWLADLVQESFLKEYSVKVIHNGIDLSVFKPTASDFRARYHCEGKTILLGVAFGWGVRKGLDVFIELSKRLDDGFQIVLVGTDEKVDQELPANIISIHRTQNQAELAEIYTAADLFVNPTREDNYPTVNMEALACGTPVVTFRTGGSPEMLDETCGSVVECDDVDALENEIRCITLERPYSSEACLKRTTEFDKFGRFEEYLSIYL